MLSGHAAAWGAEETLLRLWKGGRASPLPLQGLPASLRLWPQPLRMPRSGLKQVWVLPTAIAQLWESLAVNSDSATSVTDLPSPQRSSDEGKQGGTTPPCPVLLVGCRGDGERGHGSSAGSRRGRRRPRPLPRLGRVRVLPSCCLGRALLSRLGHPWAVGRPPASSPGSDLIERMSAWASQGRETLQHMCAKQWACVPQRVMAAPGTRRCFSLGGPLGGAVVCFSSVSVSTWRCGSHGGADPGIPWRGLSQALPPRALPASKPGTAVLDGHR